MNRNTRLDNRIIDLRTRANNAIFRIQVVFKNVLFYSLLLLFFVWQSAVGTLFREYLLQLDFVEIHSPKLLGAASEGTSKF